MVLNVKYTQLDFLSFCFFGFSPPKTSSNPSVILGLLHCLLYSFRLPPDNVLEFVDVVVFFDEGLDDFLFVSRASERVIHLILVQLVA